jgi:hypothetical protein
MAWHANTTAKLNKAGANKEHHLRTRLITVGVGGCCHGGMPEVSIQKPLGAFLLTITVFSCIIIMNTLLVNSTSGHTYET